MYQPSRAGPAVARASGTSARGQAGPELRRAGAADAGALARWRGGCQLWLEGRAEAGR